MPHLEEVLHAPGDKEAAARLGEGGKARREELRGEVGDVRLLRDEARQAEVEPVGAVDLLLRRVGPECGIGCGALEQAEALEGVDGVSSSENVDPDGKRCGRDFAVRKELEEEVPRDVVSLREGAGDPRSADVKDVGELVGLDGAGLALLEDDTRDWTSERTRRRSCSAVTTTSEHAMVGD